MKITKQKLKEIIKEELENSQNEGIGDFVSGLFGGGGNKKWRQAIDQIKQEIPKQKKNFGHDPSRGYKRFPGEPVSKVEAGKKPLPKYNYVVLAADSLQRLYNDWNEYFRLNSSERPSPAQRKEWTNLQRELSDWSKEAAQLGKNVADEETYLNFYRQKSAEKGAGPYRGQYGDEAYDDLRMTTLAVQGDRVAYKKTAGKNWDMYATSSPLYKFDPVDAKGRPKGVPTREGKITKNALKTLVKEELTKAEKARKKELEKELGDLKHK